MPTFGDKLRREREARNTTIEEMSNTTGIGLSYLEALEQDEFDELPGRAFGKLYIRAYAEVLDFDPGPLLAEYDREQHRLQASEPPGGRLKKPIIARPVMPADPPPESGDATADGPPREETSAEVREESHDEPPIEVPIEVEPEASVVEPSVPGPEPYEAAGGRLDEPEGPRIEVTRPAEPSPSEPEAPPEPSESEPAPVDAPPSTAATETPRAGRYGSSGPPVVSPDRRRAILLAALIAIPLLIVIVWAGVALRGPAAVPDESAKSLKPPVSSSLPDEPVGVATDAQPEVAEQPAEPTADGRRPASVKTETAPAPADAGEPSGGLVVDEFGVGTRVVNHRLEGRGDRFREGEVVWFLTRVRGGRRGQRIRHVWIHENAVVQSIDLALGGSHWRTQSNKTLWGVGSWAVEARDIEGRVLARASFTCERR